MPSSGRSPIVQIASLDGIRALSFGVVFLTHAFPRIHFPGQFGVTVFFFLSGFLITTLMRTEVEATGSLSLRDFYLRRALRILPPFYLVLTLTVIFAALGITHGGFAWPPVAALASHVMNYWLLLHGETGLPKGTYVYWSLSVEEHFYLLFPALFLFLSGAIRSRRARALVLLALCAVVLGWRCWLVLGMGANRLRTFGATDTRIDSLLFGCALAIGQNPVLDPPLVGERWMKRLLFPLGLLGLAVSLALTSPVARETWRYSLQGVSLAALFVAAIRFPEWWPFRPLNSKALRFVGALSYSLYLIHDLVLESLAAHFPSSRLLNALLGLGITFLYAWLSFIWMERPLGRLRRRLTSKPASGQASESAPALVTTR